MLLRLSVSLSLISLSAFMDTLQMEIRQPRYPREVHTWILKWCVFFITFDRVMTLRRSKISYSNSPPAISSPHASFSTHVALRGRNALRFEKPLTYTMDLLILWWRHNSIQSSLFLHKQPTLHPYKLLQNLNKTILCFVLIHPMYWTESFRGDYITW